MKKPLVVLAFLSLHALGMAALAADVPDALGRIQAAKAINVAYSPDSLPFSFTDKAGPAGYSIDICKRVIAQIGRRVGQPDLKVNWIPASTPDRLGLVAKGKADLDCANTSQTLGRLANVDFSNLIYLEMGGLVTLGGSKLEHVGDLGGRKIAVLKGTTTEAALRQALQNKLVNAEVVTIDTAAEGIAMLESGAAHAYAGDRIKLLGLITQAKEPTRFAFMHEEISYEPYALALPRNDSAFRLEVNRALSQVYRSGEIATIYGQWLGALGRPPDLITAMYVLYSIPD